MDLGVPFRSLLQQGLLDRSPEGFEDCWRLDAHNFENGAGLKNEQARAEIKFFQELVARCCRFKLRLDLDIPDCNNDGHTEGCFDSFFSNERCCAPLIVELQRKGLGYG